MSDDRDANAEQIAYWNDDAASRWVAHADDLDRALDPLGIAAFEALCLQRGEAVLDIGSGCATTTLDAARRVGAAGRVLAIDVSQAMLAHGRERARARGVEHARFVLADAATHAFEAASFDAAFSRFGVMFFADPVAAFANVRRALRFGARLAFVCWRDIAANPWFSVPADAVRPLVPPQPSPDPHAPGPLAFADPARVRAILDAAGFADVRCEPFDALLSAGPLASAVELLRNVGPTARLLADADVPTVARATEAIERALREHLVEGEVRLRGGVWIVTARNAAPA